MHVVEDIGTLLGKSLDHDLITAVVGVEGRELPYEHDPGHPEDERHHYVIPSLGLQMSAGPDRVIDTLFFTLEGDENVSPFPWTLASGIGPASTPTDVRTRYGTPQASGKGIRIGALPPTGPWDRFAYPPFGSLHIHYKLSGDGIKQITLFKHPIPQ